jgi:hypothetical protein
MKKIALYFLLCFFIQGCGAHSPVLTPEVPSRLNRTMSIAVFDNLSSVVSSIADTEATLAISTPQKVNNLSIPSNISLILSKNAGIEVAEGKTLVVGGPFEAPLAKVFNGPGTTRFAPTSIVRVNPEWWGAADGESSGAAIQCAIDSMERGEVSLSKAVYTLDCRTRIMLVNSGDTVDAILVPKSGVSIVGAGSESILKVADNFTAGGDYVIFAPLKGESVSDVSFKNFRIDGNGSNNLVRGSSGNLIRRAMAIWLFAGRNVRIEGLWFDNHPGTNVVKFGSDSLSYLVTDSVIENSTFNTVGGAISGNRLQSDHSTIYISGRNVTVLNNRLSNPEPFDEDGPPVAVVAGLEIHGFDMTVSGNSVENYSTGGYVVSDGTVAAENQRWTGNSFVNMSKIGISLWSIQKARNIVIDSNVIRLYGEADHCVAGIYQSLAAPDTTMGFDELTISGNSIIGEKAKRGTVWNGIQLTAATNAVISGNTIDTVSGAGILLYGNRQLALDGTHIRIEGNTIRNTGFNLYDAYPYAIEITNEGSGIFSDIQVTNNVIGNSGFSPVMRGIRVTGKGTVSKVIVDGTNSFNGIAKEHYIFAPER